MAEEVQRVQETTTQAGNTTQKTQEVSTANPKAQDEHKRNVAERIVWYVAGVLLVLLGFRFVLALLGANPSNGFADFIYDVSYPFVAPFFGLFSYDLEYGVSRFEIFTLVAMAVYTLVAWGVAKLVTINRD